MQAAPPEREPISPDSHGEFKQDAAEGRWRPTEAQLGELDKRLLDEWVVAGNDLATMSRKQFRRLVKMQRARDVKRQRRQVEQREKREARRRVGGASDVALDLRAFRGSCRFLGPVPHAPRLDTVRVRVQLRRSERGCGRSAWPAWRPAARPTLPAPRSSLTAISRT